ncbi:MAG: hypothetical protein EOO57_04925 [Hymenobacter sp.]|nr:MAG: hypothetical protein EOO57_04925 [Hymenobacter sp.]
MAGVVVQEDISYGDALCFVLANNRFAGTVMQLLERYVPNHLPLTEDYEDWGVEYATEYNMLQYLQVHPQLTATRHWNEIEKIPYNIMVGAYFLSDGQLVLSLTVAGNGIIEEKLFLEMKQLLQSEIGLLSYNYFPKFNNGAEFKALCDSL